MEHDFQEGIGLFNSRQYFEAHEAFEVIWLRATGKRKTLLHGLIQVAAAFHHHTRHNPAGFRSLLAKGCSKLAEIGADSEGIGLSGLMEQLHAWQKYLQQSSLRTLHAPPLPQIKPISEP